jgi:hypothetical protein
MVRREVKAFQRKLHMQGVTQRAEEEFSGSMIVVGIFAEVRRIGYELAVNTVELKFVCEILMRCK